ncbi:hypothetical protein B7R22_16975 [Subtercola boreus]|uniref:Recombinase RecT n=1 Tax=Subtercola boreus TaxID=120213 RepID=A0A3E0VQ40_9MICO|nr:hypothetical protein [Subtercola boreus]RFA12124.1 hypothetical protein B7R22_16975 [Subtercola boreus]
MTTDIVPYAASPLPERIEYARTLAFASLIPKSLWAPVRNKETGAMMPPEPSVGNVLLVMEHGAMLDLHPMAAINGIFIIEGKASMSANLMSAVVRGKGYKLRVFTEGSWGVDFKAVATLVRPDDLDFTYRVEWNEEKAARADLLGKDNWKKYPESMAKARAISEVIREGATDALNGIGYTPEELGASVTEGGELVQVVDHPDTSEPWSAPTPTAAEPPKWEVRISETTSKAELLELRDEMGPANAVRLVDAILLQASKLPDGAPEPTAEATDPNEEEAVEVDPESHALADEPREMTQEEFEAYSSAAAYSDEV